MVAKKRTQLRSKAAKVNKVGSENGGNDEFELPPDPNAFLNVQRETKKDKLLQKSQNFKSKILEQGKNGGISKSSIRRRKRKLRDELKPKMNDLLQSLEAAGSLSDGEENEKVDVKVESSKAAKTASAVTRVSRSGQYCALSSTSSNAVGHIQIRKNDPSIRNQKGAKALAKQEIKRFNEVLSAETFKQNPFEALREAIRMRK